MKDCVTTYIEQNKIFAKYNEVINKVTFDMAKNIKESQEIKLTNNCVLYLHSTGDNLVIVDKSDSNWNEVLTIQCDSNDRALTFITV